MLKVRLIYHRPIPTSAVDYSFQPRLLRKFIEKGYDPIKYLSCSSLGKGGLSLETKSFNRKLTTILSADVAGFSLLMQDDETATVKILENYKLIISDLVKQHRGRVVDSPGDNLLAEFASVVDAVQCAVAIQRELQARNTELPENRRMQFRIGVNLGDVIEGESRIYGDGVNIAARLESLAEPGGICISKTAFDQVEAKLPFGYVYIGEQKVKNISKPIGAYKLIMEQRIAAAKLLGKKLEMVRGRNWVITGIAAVLVIIGSAIWGLYWSVPRTEPASIEKMSFPLPEIPSIAVLPFVNRSDDPKMELFCDGVTDNIITILSKVPQIMVIARSSTSTFKGVPSKIRQASESLGVQYVLEGSIQRSEDRIRITTHLFDALKGTPVWGDTYDRNLTDIFALQDEIARKVLFALRVNIHMAFPFTSKHFIGQQGIDCYLKLVQAGEYISRWNLEDINLGRRLAEEVISTCPDVPGGYIDLGWYYHHASELDDKMAREEAIEKAIELAHKAIKIDDSIFQPYNLLCSCYAILGQLDKAIPACERDLALNPGSMDALSEYGWILMDLGRYQDSIQVFQKIIRRNPFARSSVYRGIGLSLLFNGQLDESVSAVTAALRRSPNDFQAHLFLSVLYTLLGREKEAAKETAEALRLNPKYSVEKFEKKWSAIRDPAARDLFFNTIRRTGLPEKTPAP